MRARQQTKKRQASFLRRSINWTTRSSRKQHCINVAVQSLNPVQLFVTPWTAAHQPSLSFTISWSLFKLMSIEFVLHLTISFSVTPFSSCSQSFPASGSLPISWLFPSGGRSIGGSAATSGFPMNIQGWFPLWLIGWFSLQSKGLSRVFFSYTIWKHQSFSAQLPL